MRKKSATIILCLLFMASSQAQDINTLISKTREKLQTVNDYQASGKMKTNVAFLKVPVADILIFFKKPNYLKLKSKQGVSFVPKGAVSFSMNNVINDKNFTVIDAGTATVQNATVRVAKLLPTDDNGDVILSTLYIDPLNYIVRKAITTTRENGTYSLELSYGKYIQFGLPDKIIFSFDTKDYKLPKGVTFDFDDGSQQKSVTQMKNKKGQAEILLSQYIINKGLSDAVFK